MKQNSAQDNDSCEQSRLSGLIQSMTARYQEAVEALVLSDKYDLILPRQSIHYRHELYDVTAKITEKMNALEK